MFYLWSFIGIHKQNWSTKFKTLEKREIRVSSNCYNTTHDDRYRFKMKIITHENNTEQSGQFLLTNTFAITPPPAFGTNLIVGISGALLLPSSSSLLSHVDWQRETGRQLNPAEGAINYSVSGGVTNNSNTVSGIGAHFLHKIAAISFIKYVCITISISIITSSWFNNTR